jgi:hypothetical protein
MILDDKPTETVGLGGFPKGAIILCAPAVLWAAMWLGQGAIFGALLFFVGLLAPFTTFAAVICAGVATKRGPRDATLWRIWGLVVIAVGISIRINYWFETWGR